MEQRSICCLPLQACGPSGWPACAGRAKEHGKPVRKAWVLGAGSWALGLASLAPPFASPPFASPPFASPPCASPF